MSRRTQKNAAKSWVWQYAERIEEVAHCLLCEEGVNNVFSARGGSTGSIGNHLKNIHSKFPLTMAADTVTQETSETIHGIVHGDMLEEQESSMTVSITDENISRCTTSPPPPSSGSEIATTASIQSCDGLASRRTNKRMRSVGPSSTDRRGQQCTPNRCEFIHKSLTKMMAMSQLPLSFVSSPGFVQFMAAVEPNYKPLSYGCLKKRLQMLTDQTKIKIKDILGEATHVACTSDCWTSRTQQPYLTLDVRVIDRNWATQMFTLTTQAMSERHTAVNLCESMENILREWGIGDKIIAIVTDNAANVVRAVSMMTTVEHHSGLTCAAHSLQIAANKALEHASVADVCVKASKLVTHFHHSSIATIALEKKQGQLGIDKKKLIQSVKTRWNSTFDMFERLLYNRLPITNVMADRTVTTNVAAEKLEITEREWSKIEELVILLKPLQMATTVFCGDRQSPVSMVRPLISKVVTKHMAPKEGDSIMTKEFKELVAGQLKERFRVCNLDTDIFDELDDMYTRVIASFLDPRYKDLDDETLYVKEMARNAVKMRLNSAENIEGIQAEPQKRVSTQALAFLYEEDTPSHNNALTQFHGYLAEPQLRFDLSPWDWWKARETKYPAVARLAKRYLCIPATSASSERTFSTAGNIVTSKRNCLKPENVNMLVFLFQNQKMYT